MYSRLFIITLTAFMGELCLATLFGQAESVTEALAHVIFLGYLIDHTDPTELTNESS